MRLCGLGRPRSCSWRSHWSGGSGNGAVRRSGSCPGSSRGRYCFLLGTGTLRRISKNVDFELIKFLWLLTGIVGLHLWMVLSMHIKMPRKWSSAIRMSVFTWCVCVCIYIYSMQIFHSRVLFYCNIFMCFGI